MSSRRCPPLDSRRRSGCSQCKAKHVRCTEESPRCRRCCRLNLRCERGLRLVYEDDAVQRGISFGRQGRWAKQPKGDNKHSFTHPPQHFLLPLQQYFERWIFLNTTVHDFLLPTEDTENAADPHPTLDERWPSVPFDTEDNELSLPLNPWRHPLATYSDVEGYLLDYFIQGIAPNCSLSPFDNPYISLIIPLSLVHDDVRAAVLAVSANQFCLLGDSRFERETLIFKNNALRGLYQAISSGMNNAPVIATVLMMCFHDISDNCDPSWKTHLQAGLQLAQYSSPVNSQTAPLNKFCSMYFVAHDIMGRTASSVTSQSSLYHWGECDMDEIDMTMGCSRRLLTLIGEVTQLAGERAQYTNAHFNTTEHPDAFISRSLRVAASICALTQRLPAHSTDREDLSRIAEVKRLTALLYLLVRMGHKEFSGLEVAQLGLGHCGGRITKRHLVSTIIDAMNILPDSATLLWPLFIVGTSGLVSEEHRRFVLEKLDKMQRLRNLGSIKQAKRAVVHAFQRHDLGHPFDVDKSFESMSLA